jgi:hypothetical protein
MKQNSIDSLLQRYIPVRAVRRSLQLPKKRRSPLDSSLGVHQRSPLRRLSSECPVPNRLPRSSVRRCQAPHAFRSCRSSRLQRFTPLRALQVYCTLQPAMGFATFPVRPHSPEEERALAFPSGVPPYEAFPFQTACAASPRLPEFTTTLCLLAVGHGLPDAARPCCHVPFTPVPPVPRPQGLAPSESPLRGPLRCRRGLARCSLGLGFQRRLVMPHLQANLTRLLHSRRNAAALRGAHRTSAPEGTEAERGPDRSFGLASPEGDASPKRWSLARARRPLLPTWPLRSLFPEGTRDRRLRPLATRRSPRPVAVPRRCPPKGTALAGTAVPTLPVPKNLARPAVSGSPPRKAWCHRHSRLPEGPLLPPSPGLRRDPVGVW